MKNLSGCQKIALLLLGLLALCVVCFVGTTFFGAMDQAKFDQEQKEQYNQLSEEEKQLADEKQAQELKMIDMKSHPENYIEVLSNNSKKGGFDTVAIHDIVLKNNSEIGYRNIKLKFVYTADNGTELSSNSYIAYLDILPGQELAINDINTGFVHSQASKNGVRVTDAEVLE